MVYGWFSPILRSIQKPGHYFVESKYISKLQERDSG